MHSKWSLIMYLIIFLFEMFFLEVFSEELPIKRFFRKQ